MNDKLLRFDFSHFARVSEEELRKVEEIVNERVRQNIQLLEECDVALNEAKEKGAMALFGEKYGDTVRVITFDPAYSVELCGGTHVAATGQIGLFKIVSEGSVSAGVRRIEAVTAHTAEALVREQQDTLEQVKVLLKNPKDVAQAIDSLLHERNKLAKDLEKLQEGQAGELRKELAAQVKEEAGMQVLIEKISLPSADALKKISFELKSQFERLFMVLAAEIDGKPQISVVIGEALIQEKGLHAGNLVRELAKEIKGGGGGQPFFATAGGKDLNGLDQVLEKAKLAVKQ